MSGFERVSRLFFYCICVTAGFVIPTIIADVPAYLSGTSMVLAVLALSFIAKFELRDKDKEK